MRLKSNAVWHSLPGVEAVYQPLGAPSAVDALLNVGMDHRMVGKNDATKPANPLGWSASTGWGMGSSRYLKTGVIPIVGFTMAARYVNANNVICGSMTTWGQAECNMWPADSGKVYWSHGNEFGKAPILTSGGVLCVSGLNGYRNGIWDATGGNSSWTSTREVYLGCLNENGTPGSFCTTGSMQVFLIANRTFTSDEVWLASRQMAYCEQNPDWNAWARRRNYYYAPSAAGRVGIYGRRGAVALSGGVSIRSTDNG